MGYNAEHRGRRQKVVVPGTGQFLNSTCIRTNQSNKGIRYSSILTKGTRRQRQHKRTIGQQRSYEFVFIRAIAPVLVATVE